MIAWRAWESCDPGAPPRTRLMRPCRLGISWERKPRRWTSWPTTSSRSAMRSPTKDLALLAAGGDDDACESARSVSHGRGQVSSAMRAHITRSSQGLPLLPPPLVTAPHGTSDDDLSRHSRSPLGATVKIRVQPPPRSWVPHLSASAQSPCTTLDPQGSRPTGRSGSARCANLQLRVLPQPPLLVRPVQAGLHSDLGVGERGAAHDVHAKEVLRLTICWNRSRGISADTGEGAAKSTPAIATAAMVRVRCINTSM